MNEHQIESIVEHNTNGLDARLMAGKLTQAEYDAEIKKLDRWATAEFSKAKA